MLTLGSIAFVAPWILLGLATLPVIWWLLRITPPAPRLIRFPAIRLLFRLPQKEETPAHTPLWLLLMRLAIAALVILALAHPLHNPQESVKGSGPLVVVIDNGWAAAHNWRARTRYLSDTLDRAERERRNVVVLATAPSEAGGAVAGTKLLRASQARNVIQALKPQPWPATHGDAARAANRIKTDGNAKIVWLSNGLQGRETEALAEALRDLGSVTMVADDPNDLPLLLRAPSLSAGKLTARLERATAGAARSVLVRALDDKGGVITTAQADFKQGSRTAAVSITVPSELRNRIARLDLAGQRSAGAVVLVDERWRRRPVGIIGRRTIAVGQPLLSEIYYLQRALAPYAELRRGRAAELLKRPIAVLVLPDAAIISADERRQIDAWVKKGGLLVRLAGSRLAEGDDPMVPVRLRRGDRSVGGAMTWTKPLGLSSFSANSPFAGLPIPKDVRVSRQVLAEPAADLAQKTWARLSDGTPLVTGGKSGDGWLVLVHTTASPDWSNLALSGLFVQMLRRVVGLSQGVAGADGTIALPPRETLDGFGRPAQPTAAALPVAAKDFDKTRVGPQHPPGLYGTEAIRRSLNVAPAVAEFRAMGTPPPGVTRILFQDARQTDLKPWLLIAALVLLIADMLIALALRGLIPLPQTAARTAATLLVGTIAVALAASLAPSNALAQSSGSSTERFAIEATSKTRLAYIRTGNPETDRVSRAAMRGLGLILRRRTSVEPGAPMAVDPETDILAFFPMLYWPIVPGQAPPTARTAQRLNQYMRSGGILLIDLRDRSGQGFDAIELRRAVGGITIPPLVAVSRGHVLTKSFYLLEAFPGRWAGGETWVEKSGRTANDGVSSIIIGTNDWAGAWAINESQRPMFPVVPGGAAQRERAFRTGVNVVMYALTGNYKGDQVHLPTILRRLGQ